MACDISTAVPVNRLKFFFFFYFITFPATLLCHQVRLPLLPVDFLTGTVAKEEMIRGSLSCRDLMDEARNYHLHLSNKLDFEYSARTIPRKHTAGLAFFSNVIAVFFFFFTI